MMPSAYNSEIDAEAEMIKFARAMEDRPGDMGIIDNGHVSRSLDEISIEHVNGMTEDHLAGPFQPDYAYNQFQYAAALGCSQLLAPEIPRLDIANGSSTVDHTFSPAVYTDSYASSARDTRVCASAEQWVCAYNGCNNFQGQTLPDGANFMAYPSMWRSPRLTLELPSTPIIEGVADFCGTPGSSGFDDLEGFDSQSFENLTLNPETSNFETLSEPNQMFFSSSSFPEPNQSPTSSNRPTSPTISRPYKCRVRSCLMPFKRRAELDRHRESVHQQSSGHTCPIEGCNRNNKEHGFSRKDNLRQHLRLKHDVKLPKGRGNRG